MCPIQNVFIIPVICAFIVGSFYYRLPSLYFTLNISYPTVSYPHCFLFSAYITLGVSYPHCVLLSVGLTLSVSYYHCVLPSVCVTPNASYPQCGLCMLIYPRMALSLPTPTPLSSQCPQPGPPKSFTSPYYCILLRN